MHQDGLGQGLDNHAWLLFQASGTFLSPMTLLFAECAPQSGFLFSRVFLVFLIGRSGDSPKFQSPWKGPVILWVLADLLGQKPNIGCFFLSPFTSLTLVSKFLVLYTEQASFTSLKEGLTDSNLNIYNSIVIYPFY